MLHRIVGMGVLYFVLASIEGCMRALKASLPAFCSGAASDSQLSELGLEFYAVVSNFGHTVHLNE